MALPNTTGSGSGEGLSPGDRVGGGRFVLKRLLGRGSNSEVWLAQEVTASRSVALKVFPRAFLSDVNLVEKFSSVIQRHRLLKHPHLATTYELVRDANFLGLSTEYVDGWSLASLKVDKLCNSYHVGEIETWVDQLCEVLEFAHNDLGIIHSDLKPANLLINSQEVLKVTDFEIAALIRKESSRRGLAKGLYSGLGFLSPQQVMGEEPSKLDDIYSLGATIYDLLTGTPPFYKGEVFAQICSLKAQSMTERIKELEIQDDPVPPVWEDTVARCLAKNPADRPQSITEVRELLKRESVPKPAATAVSSTVLPVGVIVKPEPEKAVAATAPEVEHNPETVAEVSAAPQAPPSPTAAAPAVIPPLVIPPPRSQMPLIIGGFVILFAALCAAGVIGFVMLRHVATTVVNNVTGTNSMVSLTPGAPGSVDAAFNSGESANGEVHGIALQPDGKIIAVGRFTQFNGRDHKNIVRLNPDGTVDDSFKHNGFGTIYQAAVEDDGRIVLVGDAMMKGRPRNHILRLNPDSAVDKGFSLGVKLSPDIRTLLVQASGEIIVGGNFIQLNNRSQQRLMRFNPDGGPDDDFDNNVSANGPVYALAQQTDGKLLVAGGFTSFNNADAGRIARLNPGGTLDNNFNSGKGADGVILGMALQSDGGIIIGGLFMTVNNQVCPHLARLNADGTVDASFAIGAGADKTVRGVAIQPDGKIIIVGDFTTVQNVPCHRIARLNPDGTLDKTFNTGGGANNNADCAVVMPDGKLLVGGNFTGFNGGMCGGLVRLNNSIAKH